MRALLDARDPDAAIPDEVYERRFLRLLAQFGLPTPVLHHNVFHGDRFVAELDFAWPAARFGVETDSYAFHSSRLAWESDRLRSNALAAANWTVMYVTWRRFVSDPAAILDEISGHLVGLR